MEPFAVIGDAAVAATETCPQRRTCRLRETEIEELGAGPGQKDVSRLQIAMDDAVTMRLVERIGNLACDGQP